MIKQFNLKVLIVLMTVLLMTTGGMVQAKKKLHPRLRLPDLTILKVTVTRDCNLAVVVKNLGPGALPDSVYTKSHPKSAGVYVWINGKKWGGQTIKGFDTAKKLQRPGGQATCILRYKVGSPISVKAQVDIWNDVKEKNERNNTKLRKKLTCGQSSSTNRLPDLTVTDIKLVKNCKMEVTIKNIGDAGVPDSYYNLPKAVAVQMYKNGKPWGGIILKGFDPAGKLKSPGGTAKHIWFPNAANLNLGAGTHSIKVEVDNGKVLTEKSETNNSLTKRLKCKLAIGTITTPPLTLSHHSIDNIRFSPGSPASLDFNQQVKVFFTYSTTEKKGVHIFARPLTNGNLTPNYKAHGSPSSGLPSGKNKRADGYFTITRGPVVVDQVRLQMTDLKQKKVLCEKIVNVKYKFPKSGGEANADAHAPSRFMVDFSDGYLAYTTASNSLQIIAQLNVLSYGSDWEKCKVNAHTYHLKQKFWSGFFWEVNTMQKKVYQVNGGAFCKGGGKKTQLKMKVDTSGGGGLQAPTRFFIRFPKTTLVYVPASKTLQITTDQKVLTYGNDWDKCNLKPYLYHLKLKSWQGFHWAINTSRKQAHKVTGGQFCHIGGSKKQLNASVRVVQ